MPEDDIKRIDDVLRENPGGLKAGRIASATGLSRAEVNSRLYGNAIKYSRSEDNLWRLNDMAFEHNPVLQKLNNRENAKVFTAEEFKAIAD